MTTDLILIRWKVEGLRCPDHEIVLVDANGAPNRITLIQMPNGTGKTTTLTLLRATLSGEATEWRPEEVRSLRKRGATETFGTFLVECLVDEKRLTITLQLNFEEETVSYSTTFGSGNKIGFHPPSPLRRFFQKDFIRLFVFDGEQAEHLLDREQTRAHDAIDSLFQLKFFDSMYSRITEYWNDHVNSATATDQKGLARRKNRVQALKARLKECRKAHTNAEASRDQCRNEVENKKRKFRDELKAHEAFSKRLRTADKALGEAKSKVQNESNAMLARLRDPYALSSTIASRIVELRANLDRVKLPESTAREFFEELSQELECVCGRPLDSACQAHIRDQASRYLGSDDVSLLNAMKSDIADHIGNDLGAHSIQRLDQINTLKTAVRREHEARTSKDSVENDAAREYPQLEKIREEIEVLQAQLDEATEVCEKYEDVNDSLTDEQTYGIIVLRRRVKDAERKLAEITQTLDLRAKRDVLHEIIKDAQELSRDAISKETVQQANARIASLMPSNSIRIKKIDNCLVLEGQEGGSMGETLSVAYAFLATFFNSASHCFPFIVDSPAGSIDLAIRPRIAELVPKLTSQFIAFTISTERQGFCDRLQKAEKQIAFFTLFRKNDAELQRQAKTVRGYKETEDGLLVPGYKFFNQFQIESE